MSAVVLAAGASRRFGSDKLMADLEGRPVIRHVLDRLAEFPFHETVMVVRPGWTVDVRGIRRVENAQADEGMGTSLALGVASLQPADAAFVVLADMPFLPQGIFAALAECIADSDIVAPRHGGQPGHPVLFSSVCFADLRALAGDRGGRDLIRSGRYRTRFLDVGGDGVLRDIDRPADLRRRGM